MNNQEEVLSSQLQEIHKAAMWLSGIPGILDLISFILILAAIIYIFTKTKAPGSLMMIIGVVFAAIFAIVPIFMVSDPGTSNATQSNMIWLIQLANSFFIFLAGFGFLKYALSINKRNES